MKILNLPLDEMPSIYMAGIGVHGNSHGLVVNKYRLPTFWCLHLCRYHGLWVVDGEPKVIEPGTAIFIKPNIPMEFHFQQGRNVHISIHFMARGENTCRVPEIQNIGTDFENVYRDLEAAVGWFASSPARASARIWDVMWSLTDTNFSGAQQRMDPLVSLAVELIERRLAESFTVAEVAEQLGVSHNHLMRQFRAAIGMTPVDFIRDRRIRYAQHLLRRSTLPIKVIAAQTGLGDFHSFNKAMRRVCGCGPREWRGQEAQKNKSLNESRLKTPRS